VPDALAPPRARPLVGSVERALSILLAFDAGRRELRVGEIASELGVHKSTASRLAMTLAELGFLERAPGEAFRLGPQIGRLGLLAQAGSDLLSVARPALKELQAASGEAVSLSIRDGDEAATVLQLEGDHIVSVKNWVGRRTPLHCTSDGKVLLAFTDGALPAAALAGRTERTIVDPARLAAELEEVRRAGVAFAIGEYEDGLHGVAAPVLDRTGTCHAAVTVWGPFYRLPVEALHELAERCRAIAARIGSLLSGPGSGNDHQEDRNVHAP
jgi:DNA-binding IclR family transcriptional regulator